MADRKHTPGPWKAKYAADGCRDIGIIGDDGVVAECFHEIRNKHEDAHEECLANARLIAAAPELLDILDKVVVFWDSITMEDQVNNIHVEARMAIAAATGAKL